MPKKEMRTFSQKPIISMPINNTQVIEIQERGLSVAQRRSVSGWETHICVW